MSDFDELLDPNVKNKSPYQGGGDGKLPNSTAVLVLGIISIVGCAIYGLPGLITGIISIVLYNKDKKIYDENPQHFEASFKNAKAGFICAVIGVSLSSLYFLFALIALTTIFANM